MRWFVSFDELSCFLFGYPKIQRMRVNNFGSILTIFFPDDVGDTWVQFLEGCPLKFGKAKTIQNPVQFLTTFDFVREYLRNGWTNRKSEKQLMNYILTIFFPDDVGDTWVQFLEGCPLKFGRAKTIQNPVQFLTTFDFVREYLRNGWTNRKSEKQLMNYILSNVERKNRELWSTNEKVIDAHIDPPKWTFFGRLYFSP